MKSLNEFTYSDYDINEVILSCMANTSIDGLSGTLHFEHGADPIKDVRIQRIEGEYATDKLIQIDTCSWCCAVWRP